MSSRGTTVVVLNPHEIGKGVRARVRPNLGEDYGVEVRQAAVARQRQERVNRAYDDAEARRAEAERQRIHELTQKTYDKAAVAQANILVAGQNQFRRFVSVGSVVAFLVGQLIDVHVFHRIRSATGERYVWLRATGSTAVSQLVDSFVVIWIAFVLGPQQWPTSLFLAVSTVNYAYKMAAAVALIPLLYLMRRAIRAYLGAERERELREQAAGG